MFQIINIINIKNNPVCLLKLNVRIEEDLSRHSYFVFFFLFRFVLLFFFCGDQMCVRHDSIDKDLSYFFLLLPTIEISCPLKSAICDIVTHVFVFVIFFSLLLKLFNFLLRLCHQNILLPRLTII